MGDKKLKESLRDFLLFALAKLTQDPIKNACKFI